MSDSDSRANAASIPPPFVAGSTGPLPAASPHHPVGPFVPGAQPSPPPAAAPPQPSATKPRPEATWVSGEWQRYDWQSAAALGASAADASRAAEAWTDLDWDAEARQRAGSRAEAVAAALEALARRIRSGDLIVRGHSGMTLEAAITATLAALLETRR